MLVTADNSLLALKREVERRSIRPVAGARP
jgi:hypothetical protein